METEIRMEIKMKLALSIELLWPFSFRTTRARGNSSILCGKEVFAKAIMSCSMLTTSVGKWVIDVAGGNSPSTTRRYN